jgi:hypothetical protein
MRYFLLEGTTAAGKTRHIYLSSTRQREAKREALEWLNREPLSGQSLWAVNHAAQLGIWERERFLAALNSGLITIDWAAIRARVWDAAENKVDWRLREEDPNFVWVYTLKRLPFRGRAVKWPQPVGRVVFEAHPNA